MSDLLRIEGLKAGYGEAIVLSGVSLTLAEGKSIALLGRNGMGALVPRVLLLDEPLEGLAPILVEELLVALQRVIREEGMSAIVVEQNAQKILGVTDHAVILERGAVVHEGASAKLKADRATLEHYLGVTEGRAARH